MIQTNRCNLLSPVRGGVQIVLELVEDTEQQRQRSADCCLLFELEINQSNPTSTSHQILSYDKSCCGW